MSLIDAAITISTNPVSRKTPFPIHDNLDPNSKATEESSRHSEKQASPKWIQDSAIEVSLVNKLMDLMPRRLNEVIVNEGSQTSYSKVRI
jgi:hypothetical protein